MRKIKSKFQKTPVGTHPGRVYTVDTEQYTQEQKNEIMKKFFGQLKDAGMYRLDDQEDEPKVSVSDE